MKIRKLQLKNIGVFDDETIEFQRCPVKDKAEIHILTGQNGSGKSTILQALITLFFNTVTKETDKSNLGTFDFGRNLFVKKLRHYTESTIGFCVDHKETTQNYNFTFNQLGSYGKILSPFEYNFENSVDLALRNYSAIANAEKENIAEVIKTQKKLEFVALAYSGYRRIKDQTIDIGTEIDENPLFHALNFVKDENSKLNVNQWLGQNLLNSSLAQTKNKFEEANRFDEKIVHFEKVINDIIADETNDNEIRFEMQSATKLVLIKNKQELDFDVLPDGLKSLISWIGDLLMRLDSLNWKDNTPIFDREIILFLDEIEVHLHPAWQRKVLPIIQKLFKNAQIFVSTHSPFVVNSVDDAWVYKLKLVDGKVKVESITKSEDGYSYSYVLEEIFDIKEEFGVEAEKELDEFYELRNSILSNGSSEKDLAKITKLAKEIAQQSEELNTIIQIEIRQINRRKGLSLRV